MTSIYTMSHPVFIVSTAALSLKCLNGPANGILLLITYVGKPPLNAHADVPSGARGLNFSLSSSTSILCACKHIRL